MQNILVTGAKGFVGRNLCAALRRQSGVVLSEYDLDSSPEELQRALAAADVIFHLAGVNRPRDELEFQAGNAGFTAQICWRCRLSAGPPSSFFPPRSRPAWIIPTAAASWPPKRSCGISPPLPPRNAWSTGFITCSASGAAPTTTPSQPPSVITVAHDLPLSISDPARTLELSYIDDVVAAFLGELNPGTPGFRFAEPLVSYQISLGALAETIRSFRQVRSGLYLPDFSRPFMRALYATYLSYLDQADFAYPLAIKSDERGSLAEFIKAPTIGQVFISRTYPGFTRGNHYHHTKVEKFLVLEGEALIRFRPILGTQQIEVHVRGEEFRVVDIPPGYTHSIQNIGPGELVTLFWSDEILDPDRPDTIYEKV